MGHTLKNYRFTGNSNLTRCPVFSFAKPVNPKPRAMESTEASLKYNLSGFRIGRSVGSGSEGQ